MTIHLQYNVYTFSTKPSLIHVLLKYLAYKNTTYLSLELAKYRGSIWYICEREGSTETSLIPSFCINQFDTIDSFPLTSIDGILENFLSPLVVFLKDLQLYLRDKFLI